MCGQFPLRRFAISLIESQIDTDPSGAVLPITVVSVCYNSTGVVSAMLASLPKGLAVVLVDNGSQDATELEIIAQGTGARLIRNADNRGFGAACNQGAAVAETEFVLFLNPDVTVEPGALDALAAAMRQYPRASAMNPVICKASGQPYFKSSSVLLPRTMWLVRGRPEADCEVPVLSGAALIVRRANFEAVGGFDPEIFLYHEDDDLGLRLRAECGPLMFIRGAVVHHEGGRSSGRGAEVAALKGWHMGRSRVYAARKHGRALAFSGALLQSLIQVVSPGVLVSKRKRAKQLAFLRGVWSARNPNSSPGRIVRRQ